MKQQMLLVQISWVIKLVMEQKNATASNFFGVLVVVTGASQSNFIGFSAGYRAKVLLVQILWFAGNQATNAENSNFMGNQAGNQAKNASNSNFLGFNLVLTTG
jgi:hypothetical protein